MNIYDTGWIEILNGRQEEYFQNTVSPVLTELFESIGAVRQMKPFDYNELRLSRKYRSILTTSIRNRRSQIRWYTEWLENLEKLKEMITEELKK